MRDVIVGRPPRIFHSYATAYATPAAAGAATYLLARKMGVSTSARIVSGVTVGILGRVRERVRERASAFVRKRRGESERKNKRRSQTVTSKRSVHKVVCNKIKSALVASFFHRFHESLRTLDSFPFRSRLRVHLPKLTVRFLNQTTLAIPHVRF